ncbi:hypothetical protein [Salinibaculum rarum]|uniref:hypothetical protein n=1 Tax=Salinibaculum rarum TaxID=3058903 RepID=UPI00265DDB02|nr:hypothetical protein [Salinibaculum sp. KK48]
MVNLNINTKTVLKAFVVFLVVGVLFTGVHSVPVTGNNTGAPEYRLFHSNDDDPADTGKLKKDENVDQSASPFDPAEYARATDLGYGSTRPGYVVNNKTVMELRSDRLQSVGWSSDKSKTLPVTPNTKSNDVIRDAHITFLGVIGGGQPAFKKGDGDEYPYFMANQGKALNYADYRINGSKLPDSYCNNKQSYSHKERHKVDDAEYDPAEYDENGTKIEPREKIESADYEQHKVMDKQTRTCYNYKIEEKRIVRTLQIGEGEKVVEAGTKGGADGRIMRYASDNAQATDVVNLTVKADITVVIVEVEKDQKRDCTSSCDVGAGESPNWGSWTVTNREVNVGYPNASVTVSDSEEVLITTNQQLDVDQTVVNIGPNKKNLILELDGPNSGGTVSSSELMNRMLLSRIVITDNKTMRTTWGAYTVEQYQQATVHEKNSTYTYKTHFPHVLKTKIYPSKRDPSVLASNPKSVDEITRVGGWTGTNVTVENEWNAPTLPDNIQLTTKVPLTYDKLVITAAPSKVDTLIGLHGQPITDIDTRRVPYHEANVEFERVAKREVKIKVTDNKTGDPLSNREVKLSGTNKSTAKTNADGEIVVRLTSAFVQVTVPGDEWKQPCAGDAGDCVFTGGVQASKTYMGLSKLLTMTYDLIVALVMAFPIALGYYWWRTYDIGR